MPNRHEFVTESPFRLSKTASGQTWQRAMLRSR
jgi:hypothetical protein